MEERNLFESRAIAAEENARNLETQLSQLQSVVASLKEQVQQLQAENLTLREYR
jgi:regulator of replication initiation timing